MPSGPVSLPAVPALYQALDETIDRQAEKLAIPRRIAGDIKEVFAEAKGGFFGQNGQDIQIIIPYLAARQRFPTEDRLILVSKARPGMRDEAYEEIRQLLRRLRKTPVDAADDFGLRRRWRRSCG